MCVRLKRDAFGNVSVQLRYGNTYLLHRIAVADRHTPVVFRIEVHGDAKRRADLVLTAVAFADGTGLVVIDHEVAGKRGVNLVCPVAELLGEREHRRLKGRKERMQVHDDARILFRLVHNLFVVSLDEECQRHTVCAE